MSQAGLTIKAAKKVYALMQEEDNLDLKLRVYIQGGGCSGFQYGFSFETDVADDDMVVTTSWWTSTALAVSEYDDIQALIDVFYDWLSTSRDTQMMCRLDAVQMVFARLLASPYANQHHVSLLVDSISYQYLEGATIDYKTGVEGEFFSVNNPHAKTTCGCGSSFSV